MTDNNGALLKADRSVCNWMSLSVGESVKVCPPREGIVMCALSCCVLFCFLVFFFVAVDPVTHTKDETDKFKATQPSTSMAKK